MKLLSFSAFSLGLISYCINASEVEQTFATIYRTNTWGSLYSCSGGGSDLEQTKVIRQELPKLFKKYRIETLLDAPCGDFYWMKEVDLSGLKCYLGIDIVQDIIHDNTKHFSNDRRTFLHLNIINDTLPKADLILCRDCFIHLPNKDIMQALHNFKKSGATYLLVTHSLAVTVNTDLAHASHHSRKINFQAPPYNFPAPLEIIDEQCTEPYGQGKTLALWAFKDLMIEE